MNFEEVYKEHSGLVYNLALQYVQNKEDAEEITQDVFVIIHNKLPSFNKNSKLSTWIYRITINRSLDYLKARKRKKRFGFLVSLFHEETAEPRQEVSDFGHPGVLLEHKEELESLFQLINGLSENQKTALILMKVDGRTQNETAEIMKVSAKAVESLVQRAKQNLLNKMDPPKEQRIKIVK